MAEKEPINFEALIAASDAVSQASKGKPLPTRGTVPCPLCRVGTISYVIRGPRAMGAKCSTPGCIAMMG